MTIDISKCTRCGRAVVPPRDICPYCGPGAGETIRIAVAGEGRVASYTVSYMPPEGFRSPLLLVLVELNEGGMVLCLGDTEDTSHVRIGGAASVYVDREGRYRYTPQASEGHRPE